MTEAPLAVIIVNFNAGSLLSACVQSVRESSPNSEIIVVDNGSSDDSLAMLERQLSNSNRQPANVTVQTPLPNPPPQGGRELLQHSHLACPPSPRGRGLGGGGERLPANKPESNQEEGQLVTILCNKANLGFAVAVNKGIRAASGRHVVVLNPDCVVEKDLFNKLRIVLELNPQAGMTGPLIVNPDGSEQAGCRREVPTPWRSFVRAFGLSRLSRRWPRWFSDFSLNASPLPDRPVEVEAISGACMYVRRQALEEVGLLDEGYFLHCEDLDWCMRFRERGWKILFVPDAIVIHHKGACSKSRPIRVEWHKHCGMVRFHNKFFRKQYPAVVTAAVWVGTWLHFALVSGYYGLLNVARRIRSTHV